LSFCFIPATIQRLGWDTQATYKESALQSVLLTTACKLNMTTVVEIARQKYRFVYVIILSKIRY